MIDRIIRFSIYNRAVIFVLTFLMAVGGVYSLLRIPLDALPDITDNIVQVYTLSPGTATVDVERYITVPLEWSLRNLPNIKEIRSISRFGLSVISVVFPDHVDKYLARQLVSQQLVEAKEMIPEGLGVPRLAPMSLGLGEVYLYTLEVADSVKDRYSLMDLRTIQDWVVRRHLSGIDGVVEINTMGGYLKQYEIAVDPIKMKNYNLSLYEILEAVEQSNANIGSAYIEKFSNAFYIRTEGLYKDIEDIENTVLANVEGTPIRVKDVAQVRLSHAPRYGGVTRNGEEVVGGRVQMLIGENSYATARRVHERVQEINKILPAGVQVVPYLNREKLIDQTIKTVRKNLIEGGLIVIFVLILFLGNLRAGLIVASVIPLSMLFAVTMMYLTGVSANLMSLGAIDFGIIVDGAVIVTEAIVTRLHQRYLAPQVTTSVEEDIYGAAVRIRKSAAFGELIILMVYLPILALVGIEGRMFKPMASTIMFAIFGALVLSLTYVPAMSAALLRNTKGTEWSFADRVMEVLHRHYDRALRWVMRYKLAFLTVIIGLGIISFMRFQRMGGEFIPTLEEGDIALQHILPPGTSLQKSLEVSMKIQKLLLDSVPDVVKVVANIGTAEIPTDPMPVEIADYVVIMKPKKEWTYAEDRIDLFEKIEALIHRNIKNISLEFSQPVQLRFNEMMSGSRAEISIFIRGEDFQTLNKLAQRAKQLIQGIEGVGSVVEEQTVGLPQIVVRVDRQALALHGLRADDVNRTVQAVVSGIPAGVFYEGERFFDLVVRFDSLYQSRLDQLKDLWIKKPDGSYIQLRDVADVKISEGPMQVSRSDGMRRTVIGVNTAGRDIKSVVDDIRAQFDRYLPLPEGYSVSFGGQYENFIRARNRLALVVPLALLLILVMLYFTFHSIIKSILIFFVIPLAAIGGIWSLTLRDMPFSISAGIGFIALFGVAVLNGIVLIGAFDRLKREGVGDLMTIIYRGTHERLRPVLITMSVASLGFLPMALSTSQGAEVQRPLATVVIGGLITATILTLFVLPILYYYIERGLQTRWLRYFQRFNVLWITVVSLVGLSAPTRAQQILTLEEAIQYTKEHYPLAQYYDARIQGAEAFRDIRISLGNTEVFADGEGLWRDSPERRWQYAVQQQIPVPSKTKAIKGLWNARGEALQVEKGMRLAQLEYRVREVYFRLQNEVLKQAERQRWLAYTEEVLDIARTAVAQGALSRIALNAMELKRVTLVNQIQAGQANIRSLEYELRQLTGQPQATVDTQLYVLPPPLQVPQTAYRVQLVQAQSKIADAEIQLAKSQRLPDVRLQYGAEYLRELGWFGTAGFGVSAPIFNTTFRSRIRQLSAERKALDWQIHMLITDAENLKQQYQNEIEQLQQAMQREEEWVFDKLRSWTREAEDQYEKGIIDYQQLYQMRSEYLQAKMHYFDTVLQYNQKVAAFYRDFNP